jgi:adenosyl cobinamide kinase/adenosyl cobinamide phosphate guanylyltransferase
MDHKEILRRKPWLKLENGSDISSRLLKATNGNAFIVWDCIQANYELHTVQAELLSGDSYNATVPKEVINQWLIDDYLSNDFEKYVDDFVGAKMVAEMINDESHQEARRIGLLNQEMETVERVMGTKI